MKITKQKENETLTVFLEGRLDTNTGPELNKSLESDLDEVKELIIDLESLSYLSSVGLRILIGLQQKM
ncbi:MAG: STAS domain-containing protein, partial [Allobaculum sp.]|nr:STAS domain-containing protein [Allobaculum sp.]